MEKLFGKSAYEGISINHVYLRQNLKESSNKELTVVDVEEEKEKLEITITKARDSLLNLKESLEENNTLGMDINIIDSHLLLLSDPMYIKDIEKEIASRKPIDIAIEDITNKYVNLFEKIKNPIYRQRQLDIKDVSKRLLDILHQDDTKYQLLDNKILVTKELFPSELLRIHKEKIHLKGIIMEFGGETSHVAILAKALKIPTLMGVENIFDHAWNGEIILDTFDDKVAILEPTKEILEEYEIKQKQLLKIEEKIKKNSNLPAVTKDGEKINLYLNIGGDKKTNYIDKSKIEGVGLLRTEFIYMKSNSFPNEEKQLEMYREITREFSEKQTIIIRTLDIGADKQLSYFNMKNEKNPFLGLRGLRFSLENIEIFKTQLRAILRLSSEKNIKIMYPMVTNVVEVKKAHEILEIVKNELRDEGKSFDNDIEVGIMVEVPSVILMAEEFAKEVDFFSVGSNDLTQYILATDRLSETVGYLYDSFNPSILRAINILQKAASKYNKKVSVCGEMAGNPKATLALMSIGIRDFSMVEPSIPTIKTLIRNIDIRELEEVKEKILGESDIESIKKYLKEKVGKNSI